MAAPFVPTAPNLAGGLIDPTKQAEYPILLGDKLAGKPSSRDTQFINIAYNYKPKGATPRQKTTITSTDTPDIYKLTIQDKAGNAERSDLTYIYHGGVDPISSVPESESSNLVLVFDPKRKAFILEPVSTKVNFNLRSAPGKTEKQVLDQYGQLEVLPKNEGISGDDGDGNKDDDDTLEVADEDNPYDYRHFLPKKEAKSERRAEVPSSETTPDPVSEKHSTCPAISSVSSVKANPRPLPKTKPQISPLRPQIKRVTKSAMAKAGSPAKAKSKPTPRVDAGNLVNESPPPEEEPKSASPTAPTAPNSNIVVDGDLIIDWGSPPPERPKIKLNPRDFASGNTSANEGGYGSGNNEGDEDIRSPSPPRLAVSRAWQKRPPQQQDEEDEEEEEEEVSDEDDNESEQEANDDEPDDDGLEAEMEAAFVREQEEEERARNLLLQQQQQQQRHIVSDEESEVSEEE
ncbi:hypothetical protein D8B26_003081 [Coccidioides posadasii str. Silveira]|uniref:Uncharacterized protein n=1 Tax=Coccidioides posadasii (strain RMSCC 757 / Silveira) TaxID=443226 RepID=E9CZB8_COCPS|nr:hypothetical protein CPSG_02405 [Coccidioides posadasii str. Silveira]QVM08389.1 hypothetical protein D8B26_003081 [Coccidioides posadasii str. Silveira]